MINSCVDACKGPLNYFGCGLLHTWDPRIRLHCADTSIARVLV